MTTSTEASDRQQYDRCGLLVGSLFARQFLPVEQVTVFLRRRRLTRVGRPRAACLAAGVRPDPNRPKVPARPWLLCGCQRRRIEGGRGIVTFAARIPVALSGCQCKPLVRLGDVFLGPETACDQDGKIELAVGDAIVRSLTEPQDRVGIVRLAIDPFGIEHGKIVQRLGMAGFTGSDVVLSRGVEVLLHPDAFFIIAAEPELRRPSMKRTATS